MLLETMLEDLERERGQEGAPACLSDSILEELVAETPPSPEAEVAQKHLADCLRCVHAYASLRRLFDLATPEDLGEVAPVQARAPGLFARAVGFCESMLRRPVASGWAVSGALAAVLLTWIITSEVQWRIQKVGLPGGIPSEMIGLAHRADATSATIRGVIDTVRDATAHGVEAHVLTIRDSGGATYVLFAWGPAMVRQGQIIEIRATFVPANEPGAAPTYKGIAQELVETQSR
jgi:hypothetical protein